MKLTNRCRCVLCENPRKHYKKARFKRMLERFANRRPKDGEQEGK